MSNETPKTIANFFSDFLKLFIKKNRDNKEYLNYYQKLKVTPLPYNTNKCDFLDSSSINKIIEKEFDNSKYNFKIAEAYNLDVLNNLIQEENDKMKEAKVDAENYMNNPE